MYRNRIIDHVTVDASALRANPRNHRRHGEHQRTALRTGLAQIGIVKSLVGFYAPGEDMITLIDGEARWLEGGEWPVEIVDLAPWEADAALAWLDKIGADADIDAEALIALLDRLPLGARQASAAMWSDAELAALLPPALPTPGQGGDEFDITPAASGPTRTQLGDLWIIGDGHRLMVGDCTDPAMVARLMDGAAAAALFTDPSYGVDYAGQNTTMYYGQDRHGVARETFAGDTTLAEATATLAACLPLFPADILFIWHAPHHHTAVRAVAERCEWDPFVVLIWNKNMANFGALGARYKPKFEMAIGCKHDRIPWFGPENETTVWDIDRASVNEWHPTQKPIELFARLMRNHTQLGQVCAEPFAGGGAQIIAAHRTGRRCYAMEVSTQYSDVILRRCEAEGLSVRRAND